MHTCFLHTFTHKIHSVTIKCTKFNDDKDEHSPCMLVVGIIAVRMMLYPILVTASPSRQCFSCSIKLQLFNACYFLAQCTEELFPTNAMTTGEKEMSWAKEFSGDCLIYC